VAKAGSGDDPVTNYARAVTECQILTNRLVCLACKRHLDDLSRGGDRGLRFDPQGAQHAIQFFGFLRHSKGEWAGQPFTLAPWQVFVVGCLFGWKRADGLRRFRTAYCAVPRKNGKSTLSAGIGLYLLVADGEQGAEIYSAATSRDQARIVFDEAKRMVGSSPSLKRRVGILINNLHVAATSSRFMPLSSDSSTMDGLNVHGAVIDELHTHKTRNVVDVLNTATGARRQPLLFEITTAGYDRHSICYEHHDYSIKVLEGTVPDDSWFAFIAAADDHDDWTDPKVWQKATSPARPRRRSPCPAPRTRSGACTSTSGPSRPSAGSTWRRGTPAMLRSISSSCAGGSASAGSTFRPPPTSRRSPGCSRPSRTMASGGCSRATSCPRSN
jgi:phage terminase large subunit-like protein